MKFIEDLVNLLEYEFPARLGATGRRGWRTTKQGRLGGGCRGRGRGRRTRQGRSGGGCRGRCAKPCGDCCNGLHRRATHQGRSAACNLGDRAAATTTTRKGAAGRAAGRATGRIGLRRLRRLRRLRAMVMPPLAVAPPLMMASPPPPRAPCSRPLRPRRSQRRWTRRVLRSRLRRRRQHGVAARRCLSHPERRSRCGCRMWWPRLACCRLVLRVCHRRRKCSACARHGARA